jgi:hypothetical protein
MLRNTTLNHTWARPSIHREKKIELYLQASIEFHKLERTPLGLLRIYGVNLQIF